MGDKLLPDAEGFVTVPKKKSAKKKILKNNTTYLSDISDFGHTLRRIEDAVVEIEVSNFFSTLKDLLKDICSETNQAILHIVCLGLGPISHCKAAQYQLALLLNLKRNIGCQVEVFDPVFNKVDKELLRKFQLSILTHNSEGKITVNSRGYTFFFLPHCPKELINNILFSNWNSEKLNKCLLYGNSFEKLILNTPSRFLEPFHYLIHAASIVEEKFVPNSFKFSDIFNDLSLHYFSAVRVSNTNNSFWNHTEPCYQTDTELILGNGIKKSPSYQYVIKQYRRNQTTGEQTCKAIQEAEFMTHTYLCYLQSSRKAAEIKNEFHGRGERTVRNTADMVGFKLPHDPK